MFFPRATGHSQYFALIRPVWGSQRPQFLQHHTVVLRWDDLDIQNRTISVAKQYIKNPGGKLTLSRPKTETSVRRVSIPQEAVDLLIQEHDKHPENPYMFPSSTTGEMYYPDSVVKLHQKILRDAGLEHISFHALRHSYAVAAIQSGDDIKTVQGNLDHATASFTLDVYGHVTEKKTRERGADAEVHRQHQDQLTKERLLSSSSASSFPCLLCSKS